ncbi:hypothetical protein MN116_002466 [Schistosoma mekongi]|uniref:Alpha-mannosidase n=1 Tax=Schistosoma mekongi TaxID=38744 RepID=A0AAE2D8V7_SCHME|nr:hypothetical protein MN116_002466 [Schistosoma mekongi]
MHKIDGKLMKHFTSSKCGYESCDLGKSNYLNVHLVPHTHNDVGWLKTIDQYYYGTNNTIQRAGVQYILDSVISALAYHPKRKFTFVEIVYFYQWWIVQSEQIKQLVKDLVQSGQLQFALGGWTMADEAAVYYSDAIDQLTRERDVLKQLFGDCGLPLVAWQIDPFGHSRDHSNLLQDAGYDAVYFQRIDYREKVKRKEMKQLEILWDTTTTTKTINTTSKHAMSSINNSLFTGIFYDTYCYPNGFEYDDKFILNSIVDNPFIQEYNVDRVVKEFINYVKRISKVFQTNHVMVLMGCDFTYEAAHINYNNMDKLIKYVNEQQKLNDSQVNLLYSTPACYTKAVNDAFNKIGTISRRGGDFFPYASGPHSYWTGYYTSRPALKYYVRQASNLLAMCEHIHLFANHILNNSELKTKEEQIDSLRNVLSILQHHDAITGTAKQHVTNDYAKRLSIATKSCQTLINYSYIKLLPNLEKYHSNVKFCDLLNISLCNTTENYQLNNNNDDGIFILLYNPLGWKQSSTWIRFPVYIPYDNDNVNSSSNKLKIIIKDLSNNLTSQQSLPYQLKLIDNRTLYIPERKSSLHKANYEVLFNPTNLLPIGFKLFYFFIDRASSSASSGSSTTSSVLSIPIKDPVGIAKNIHLQLFYNEVNNTVEVIMKHIKSGIELKLTIELLYYESETQPPQPSGAYVFLPKRNSSVLKFNSSQGKITYGSLVNEAYIQYTSWASFIVRHYYNDELEVEWTIGSYPDDVIGRETIIRYTINENDNIQYYNTGEFFTDSSGRRLIKRLRNQRYDWSLPIEYNEFQNITSNYYPIVNRIMLKNILLKWLNEKISFGLAVYTDRSQGGTSLKDGQLELMLHRQTVYDDGLGVNEPLIELGLNGKGLIVRGTHQIQFNELSIIEYEDSRKAQIMRRPIIPLFMSINQPILSKSIHTWHGITSSLPNNIHLLSLTSWPLNIVSRKEMKKQILIRLENIESMSSMSSSSQIDVTHLFTDITIVNISEMILTADQFKMDVVSRRLNWPTESSTQVYTKNYFVNGTNVILCIPPEKIITYILDYVINRQ